MSGIEKIVKAVTNLLEKARAPFIPIPAMILACSVFKRPGMSAMMLAANIIRRQSEFGAPTGALPSGAPNKMNALISVISEELIRELQENCVIEGVSPAGTMDIQGTGMSPIGPITFTATNVTPVKVTSIPR